VKKSATRKWLDDMKYHQCDSSCHGKNPCDGVWTFAYACMGCGKRFTILQSEFDASSVGTPEQAKLLADTMKTKYGRMVLGVAMARHPTQNHATGF